MDIIERAEALNPHNNYAWRAEKASMFPDLLAALRDARSENERLRQIIGPDRLADYGEPVAG